LILFGIVSPETAVLKSIKWDVMGIYWGFMMLSMVFIESRIPELLARKMIKNLKKERYIIVAICALTALISAFMENVGTVLIMAPIAIMVAKKLKSNLFYYLVAIALSANVVTTVTMVADPPSLILASVTGMHFLDFYWFQGRIGLGIITLAGVFTALVTLLFLFRKMKKRVKIPERRIKVNYIPLLIFIGGIVALAVGPYFGVNAGPIGLAVGILSLLVAWKKMDKMLKDFDWNSFFFIMGIFIVISSLEISGLLSMFVGMIGGLGISNAAIMLAIIIWISVAASSFIDNVPYTVLMIPVCTQLAGMMGVSPFPFLFGMLVGTAIGGNISPIGSTAAVFATGMLEKKGYKIKLKEYLKISVPFSILSVLVCHILIQLIWL